MVSRSLLAVDAMNDFIETYKMSENLVDTILSFHELNEDKSLEGICGHNEIDKNVKDSMDFAINPKHAEEPISTYMNEVHKCIELYASKYNLLKQLCTFGITESIGIQKYPIGGGYKELHTERIGHLDKSIKRVLVFMTYLNDVDDGGTEFVYQNRIVKAEKCKTLIFPSDWTHAHKGQISSTKEKIIITGWYSHIWDW